MNTTSAKDVVMGQATVSPPPNTDNVRTEPSPAMVEDDHRADPPKKR